MVLYMYSCFWLLGVESRDFSHAEKKELSKFTKITIIYSQKRQPMITLSENSFHFLNLLFYKQFFFFQHEKSHVTQLPTAKN